MDDPCATGETLAQNVLREQDAAELAEAFKALADPTRLRLISALVDGEHCVGELAGALDMTLSAVSHQLRLLRRLRVVRARRRGRHILYRLDDAHIETIYRCGLEHVRHQGLVRSVRHGNEASLPQNHTDEAEYVHINIEHAS